MRARALVLASLLAAGCATSEPPAAAPPATSPQSEREQRLHQAAVLKYQGHALGLERRYGQAIPLLQRSVALNPDDAETHAVLGTVLAEVGRFPLAALSFERAHELVPGNPSYDAGLGNAYLKMGLSWSGLSSRLRHGR